MPPDPQQERPAQEHRTVQEIIVHVNRKQTIWRAILLDLLFLFVLFLFCFSLISIVLMIAQADPGPGDVMLLLAALAIPFLLILALVVLLGLASWNMTSQFLFIREPYLVINHDGITVGKQALLRKFFIPWAEIASLSRGYTSPTVYKCLDIRPKNGQQFFARFSVVERLNLRRDLPKAKVALPQFLLAEPIEAILLRVHEQYARELKHHAVWVEAISPELLRSTTREAKRNKGGS